MKIFIQNLNKFLLTALSFILITTNVTLYADDKKLEAEESADTAEQMNDKKKDKKEFESIEEFIEDGEYKKIEGFMNILHETEKDKYYLIIEKEKLNKEFIYFTYILNGPQAVGASGGSLGDGSILEFRKFKDDIGLYKINTKFTLT